MAEDVVFVIAADGTITVNGKKVSEIKVVDMNVEPHDGVNTPLMMIFTPFVSLAAIMFVELKKKTSGENN